VFLSRKPWLAFGDLDQLGLRRLRLRNRHQKNSVPILGFDLIRLHGLRKKKAAFKRAPHAFLLLHRSGFGFFLRFALSLHLELVIGADLDTQVFFLDSGKIETELVMRGILLHVTQGFEPGFHRTFAPSFRKRLVHQLVHPSLEVQETPERTPCDRGTEASFEQ